MSSVLDLAVQYTKGIRAGGLLCTEVPELGPDVKIYHKPLDAINADETDVLDAAEQRGLASQSEGWIDVLMARALDKDGNKLFPEAEKATLKFKVSQPLIKTIIRRMNATDNEKAPKLDVEELAKN